MKAFHDDLKIKEKYLDRVTMHEKADEIIKGQYWEDGKGCAVGCTIYGSDHKEYEKQLGIPQWLARVEDRIFEGLPNKRAKTWPREFLQVIVFLSLKGVGYLFGIGIKQRNKCWQSELRLRKDPKYREYFD